LIAALVEGTPDLTLDIVQDENRMTLLQARDDRYVSGRALPSLVIPFISKPHEHCIINNQPTNLEELHNQLAPTGINLRGVVRKKLVELARKNRLPAFGFLILLLLLHRKRSESAEPEPEIVAFLCMGEQANKTGLVELARAVGATVAHNNSKRGQDVPVMLMAVHMELTQETAALYSGNDNLDIRLVGVGAGALGSQVIMNAVRGGLTEWVVIDDDHLLPHNLVRYSLSGVWLGHAKAKAVAFEANALLDQTTVTPIVADVLKPHRHANAVEKALKGANAIIDLSASVAVARHLTLDVAAPGKRCSVFVSPSGNDLVFLGEDADRQILLDQIEAQYYRAIVSDDRLKGHLTGGSTVGSCRNLTSRVPQHLMGLHAAQSVKLLRSWLQSEQASASIIRNDAPSSVYSTFTISLGNHIDVGALGGWEVVTDRLFLDELRTQRNQYLPNETGGVLLAHVDAQRHKIYVCHQIPAPPDSERQPTMYIRGCVGLEAEYEHVQKATLNNLVYIGEWHSHPDGCQCAPSNDDLRAGQWLAERTRTGSLPGIMLIAGEREQTCWMLCAQKATTAPVQIFLT